MSRKNKITTKPRIRPADGWVLFACACGFWQYVHPQVIDAAVCLNKSCEERDDETAWNEAAEEAPDR